MINLFQASNNDQALIYLRSIFGSMNGIIYDPTNPSLSGEVSLTILGNMFRTFNSVVLTVGVLIVIYVTVWGVMLTAHEGEFMGKKWNNLWLPIRTVLGIASLVPTGSGYCALQIVMMWVIVQGVGAADRVWSTALSYVNQAGSPGAQLTLPSASAISSLTAMFNGFLCQASFYNPVPRIGSTNPVPDSVDARYYCYKNSGTCFQSTPPTQNPNAHSFQLGPGGVCGSVTYCDKNAACGNASGGSPNSIACAACQAQVNALWAGGGAGTSGGGGIIPVLYAVAQKVADADYAYQKFYIGKQTPNNGDTQFIQSYCADNNLSPCCVQGNAVAAALQLAGSIASGNPAPTSCPPSSSFPSPGSSDNGIQSINDAGARMYWNYVVKPAFGGSNFLQTNANEYISSISTAVQNFIQQQGDSGSLQKDLAQAQSLGWIFAGSYYYTLSQKTANNLTNAIPSLDVTPPDTKSSAFTKYRNNYATAGEIVAAMANETSSTFRSTPQLSPFQGPVNATFNNIGTTFSTATKPSNSGTAALLQVQTAGRVMLALAEVIYPELLAITMTLGLLGCFDVFVLGNSVTNPFCGSLTLTYFIFIPGMFALIGYMVAIGGLLGIYVPLIPYIIFTFGAVGWLISTVEAMVAGPLVALGVLSPSGQHELLGKAEPALMLLFNVFLRPTLMIFGMMAAMFISAVVITMINYGFWITVAQSLMVYDPLGFVIFLSAYVMLVVAALNKSFQTISIVPERVMSWISGQGQQFGEAEALQEAKSGVTAATGSARGGMESLHGKGESAVKAKRKAVNKPKTPPTLTP